MMWLNSMLITQVEEKKNSFSSFAFNSVKALKYTVMSETGGSESLMDDDADDSDDFSFYDQYYEAPDDVVLQFCR